jgi:hypothetical protein
MAVYTLFGQSGGDTIVSDSGTYTLGMQFTLSAPATLTGIWFYSASGASFLPVGCAVYQMTATSAGTTVAGSVNLSPSWSGAAGSGWVKCAYGSGPVLAASTVYKVTILKDTSNLVYSATAHYWDGGGPGNLGLTSGIITTPNNAGGDQGQDTFHSGSVDFSNSAYPDNSFNATNYWVDVEVSTGSPASPQAQYLIQGRTSRLAETYRFAGQPG